MAEEGHRNDRFHIVGAMDVSFIHANSDFDSWLYHGHGKLRFDERHDGLRVNRIFLDLPRQPDADAVRPRRSST